MKSKIPIATYLDIEATTATALTNIILKVVKPTLRAISTAVSKGDYDTALQLAGSISVSKDSKVLLAVARAATTSAYLFGVSRVSPVTNNSIPTGGIPKFDTAVKQLIAMVHTVIVPAIIAKVQAGIFKEEELVKMPKVVKADMITQFESGVNAASVGIANDYALMVSSLHTSRLSAWGFVLEADIFDITEYAINEQLDGRTCPVCKIMHGKHFRVQDAYKTLEHHLSIENVMDLKVLAPWAKQDKLSLQVLAEMSSSDLVAAGHHVPPYHPLCRGMLAMVGDVTPNPPPEPNDATATFVADLIVQGLQASVVDLHKSNMAQVTDTTIGNLLSAAETPDAFEVSLKGKKNAGVSATKVAASLPATLKKAIKEQAKYYISTSWDVSELVVEGMPPTALTGDEPPIVIATNGTLISGAERVLYAMSLGESKVGALVPAQTYYLKHKITG